MFYTNGIWYAIGIIFHNGFHYFFSAASSFHAHERAASAIRYIIVMIFTICKNMIILISVSKQILISSVKVLHKHQLKIFSQRFNHRFFVHLLKNIIHRKIIALKTEIKKFKPRFVGKYHAGAAIGHCFYNKQPA